MTLFYIDLPTLSNVIYTHPPLYPQKNCQIRASISWHKPLGNLKQDMVYIRSAWATALIKISLIAWDKSFPSHPWNFFQTCYFMLSKLSFFFLPIKLGRPKYFSYCWTTGTPRASLIASCTPWDVDLLKNRVVLSLLICWLDALS